MNTALITGARGFCARHLAERLASAGARVIGLDCQAEPPAGVPLHDYLVADLADPAPLAEILRQSRPDLVFHLAGRTSGTAGEIYRTNLAGGLHLLDAVRRFAPRARVLMVGSAAEYGAVAAAEMPIAEDHPCRPVGAYGVSKYAATLAALDYARNQGLHVVVARPFNIVGAGVPASLVVGAVLRRIRSALADETTSELAVGNLDTQRDFIAVEDAATAYIRLLEGDHRGEVFNICSGQPRSIRSIVEQLLAFAPRKLSLRVDPALVRAADVAVVYGSWNKAREAFGFAPSTPLAEALRSAWNHEFGSGSSCV